MRMEKNSRQRLEVDSARRRKREERTGGELCWEGRTRGGEVIRLPRDEEDRVL